MAPPTRTVAARLRGARLRRFARWLGWLGPLVLLLAVSLPHLDQGDFNGDTGWYSAVGLSAWRSGQCWTLYGMPGQPYFNKPPLAFWIHGGVLAVLGPSVWAARLPTLLAAAIAVCFTNAIGRRLLGPRAGALAAGALALSIEFFRRTREVSLDMWQLAFMLGALWLVLRGVRRAGEPPHANGAGPAQAWPFALAGFPLGLALLCKPLTGLVMLPVAAAMLATLGHARQARMLLATLAVAIAVAAPWHASMVIRHGDEFLRQYLGAEVVDRAAGRLERSSNRSSPWWFYCRQIAANYWPWLACVALAWLSWARLRDRARPAMLAAAVWAGAWLAVLSAFPDRRDRYALPIYPALAWMASAWLAAPAMPWAARVCKAARWWGPPIAAALGIAVAIAPIRVQAPPAAQWSALYDWLDGPRAAEPRTLWVAGQAPAAAARAYLRTGEWPRATMDRWGAFVGMPTRGDLVLYHRRCGLAPGGDERTIWERDDLRITRVGDGLWTPVPVPDPGER
ncbi:MAG: glycosyltransferase family 39 protein [Phycisphaerae bacterium]|nr:glycosyltransferase family 39 protein [Phycisphaerae bacterium]